MKIICIACQAKFNIADEKIPRGRNAFIRCPKCQDKVKIPAFKPEDRSGATAIPDIFATSFMSETDNKALVCIDNDSYREIIFRSLTKNEYQANAAESSSLALEFLEIQQYNAIVIDENYEKGIGKKIIMEELERMDMSFRRDICIILLSKHIRTGDNMSTLNASVNKVINYKDINIFDNFFMSAVKEHRQFYSVYNIAMQTVGKI